LGSLAGLWTWRKFLTLPGFELQPFSRAARSQSLYRLRLQSVNFRTVNFFQPPVTLLLLLIFSDFVMTTLICANGIIVIIIRVVGLFLYFVCVCFVPHSFLVLTL
jgi:hypothetical protein